MSLDQFSNLKTKGGIYINMLFFTFFSNFQITIYEIYSLWKKCNVFFPAPQAYHILKGTQFVATHFVKELAIFELFIV